jgi:hypothetical protein
VLPGIGCTQNEASHRRADVQRHGIIAGAGDNGGVGSTGCVLRIPIGIVAPITTAGIDPDNVVGLSETYANHEYQHDNQPLTARFHIHMAQPSNVAKIKKWQKSINLHEVT